jgi:hypothetical protein
MTTQMIRKQIYIQKRQDILLKRLSQARGLSEAEFIRQAIEREIGVTSPRPLAADRTAWEELLAFLKQREGLGVVGEHYRWNRQELYEEREDRWVPARDQE